jgi:glycerol-3-phosphate dehydrogenase (NAD(P)+)
MDLTNLVLGHKNLRRNIMNITVLGCGRWGSFHAWYADHLGHTVTLWGRPGSQHMKELVETGKNEYVTLPKSITLTSDLQRALTHTDVCIISISSQQLRSFARQLKDSHISLTLAVYPLYERP